MSEPSKVRRILSKVYRLVKTTWGKILFIFASFPILRYIYNAIDFWGNAKMVAESLPPMWPYVVRAWSYVNTTAGSLIVSLIGFALIALQLNRQDRRALQDSKEQKPAELPTIEILSPFDNDEVGLYETVRGRVFPPDQKLQAAVFAGDKQWYPQSSPVIVTGSTWSVKCQFGTLDKPRKGSYKVVVLSDNALKKGVTYKELPADIPKSNIITVHKPEVTTEQQLATARSECDKYKGQLQTATNAFTDLEEQIDKLKDELKQAQHEVKEANLRANEEKSHKDGLYNLYKESEGKLAALKWVQDILKRQQEALQDHVVINQACKVRVDLLDTRYGPPRIRFGFQIRNEALPNITIHEKGVAGKVYFRDHPLADTCRFDPNLASNVENIEHKKEGWLFLDQKFTDSDIDRINRWRKDDPNAEFSFERVLIKVSGADNFPHEATDPLKIPGDYQRVKLKDCQFNSNTENP